MTFNPEIHRRRSIRLKGYDYSRPGAFFITICVHNRDCLFGEIVNGRMELNENGKTVESEWLKTPAMRPNIELGEFVIMPNHFHGIIVIVNNGSRGESQYAPTEDAPTEYDIRRGESQYAPTEDAPTEYDIRKGESQYAPTEDVPIEYDIRKGVSQYAPTFRSPSQTIGAIIRGFKSAVTKRINIIRRTPGRPVWQRNYYEHIIRDEDSCRRISEYIINNPRNWAEDDYHGGRKHGTGT